MSKPTVLLTSADGSLKIKNFASLLPYLLVGQMKGQYRPRLRLTLEVNNTL